MTIEQLLKSYADARKEHKRLEEIQDAKYRIWQEAGAKEKKEWSAAVSATDKQFSTICDLERKIAAKGDVAE